MVPANWVNMLFMFLSRSQSDAANILLCKLPGIMFKIHAGKINNNKDMQEVFSWEKTEKTGPQCTFKDLVSMKR